MKAIKSKSLPWDVVEKAINKEIKWLEETIEDSPFNREEKFSDLFAQETHRKFHPLSEKPS